MASSLISETLGQFAPLSDISQGSVETYMRRGGIFSDANFLMILTVKQFENRLIFNKVKAYKNCANFWATQ